MKIYLVGGAVRDQLLGLPVKERDYVVVGSTPEKMSELGFKPVGKEFPVFLHPKTKEEYALARTEKKISKGYKGFEFYTSPHVTLEEDLKRRDFTINAMAMDENGKIIDPFNGKQDLEKKILRHVSEAFAEDPVRILRAARFAARFADFSIHPDTLQLMQHMAHAGEVDALISERVWQEFYRALNEDHPERFLEVLQEAHALTKLFPALEKNYHAVLTALKNARSFDSLVRFAAMFYTLSPHETQILCEKNRVPLDYRDLAQMVATNGAVYFSLNLQSANEILDLLEKVDAFRRPERFDKFLQACSANMQQSEREKKLQSALKIANEIDVKKIIQDGFTGKEIGDELKKRRLEALLSSRA